MCLCSIPEKLALLKKAEVSVEDTLKVLFVLVAAGSGLRLAFSWLFGL